jgi:hypothetical protein
LDPTLENGDSPTTWYPNDVRPARTQNINAGIERLLPGNILLKVGYVGTLAHGLISTGQVAGNQLNPQYLSLGSLLLQPVTSSAAQTAGIEVPYAGFSGSVAQALLPFPQYHGISNIASRTGYSEYNSLQVVAEKRLGQGLFFLVSYTNAKQLTNLGSFAGAGSAWNPTDEEYNGQISSKHFGTEDRPQTLVLSYVYQLPFGPGKPFAKTTNPVLKQLIGGWQVTGLQQYTSGDDIGIGTQQSIPGNYGGIWANRVLGVPITSTGCGSYDPNNPSQNRYLNINAFADPAPFTFGNTNWLSNVRNCGYYNENFSAQKFFKIHERASLLFSADFTNLFNRHTWTGLQTNIDNPGIFGRYTGATDPRLVQFHLKVEF